VKEEGDTIFESALAEFEEAVDTITAAGTNIKTQRRRSGGHQHQVAAASPLISQA
jgi:hypothetical protein